MYIDYNGREQEDLEMDNMRRDAREEKPAYPDLALTGEDIHRAFCIVLPDEACSWDEAHELYKMQYDAMAKELNREIAARQAWTGPFEGENKNAQKDTETHEEML